MERDGKGRAGSGLSDPVLQGAHASLPGGREPPGSSCSTSFMGTGAPAQTPGPGQALCWNSCLFHRGSSRFLGRERLVCKAPGSGQTGHRSGQASFLDSAPDPTPSSPMGRPGCCPVCRLVFTLCLLFARIPRFSFTCWGPSSRHGPPLLLYFQSPWPTLPSPIISCFVIPSPHLSKFLSWPLAMAPAPTPSRAPGAPRAAGAPGGVAAS